MSFADQGLPNGPQNHQTANGQPQPSQTRRPTRLELHPVPTGKPELVYARALRYRISAGSIPDQYACGSGVWRKPNSEGSGPGDSPARGILSLAASPIE